MKNKEEKAQETETRRPYEKPVLVVISTKESQGKGQIFKSEIGSIYAPS
jgi:hypothetical protein